MQLELTDVEACIIGTIRQLGYGEVAVTVQAGVPKAWHIVFDQRPDKEEWPGQAELLALIATAE